MSIIGSPYEKPGHEGIRLKTARKQEIVTKKTVKAVPLRGASRVRASIREAMEESILSAAVEVMMSEGFAVFSLRRVAAAADIRLSTLQYHFPTFDELLSATVKRYMDSFLNDMNAIVLMPSRSPEDKMRKLISCLIKLVRAPGNSQATFEVWAVGQRNERTREILRIGYETYRNLIQKAIEQITPGLNSDDLQARATLIGAQIDGLLLYSFEGGPKVRDWAAVSRLCEDSALYLSKR